VLPRLLGPGVSLTEQLPSAYAGSCVDGAYLDSIAPQSGEHGCVGSSSSNHFCKHRRDRRNRELLAPHLDDQCANMLPSRCRSVR
jgi:hypothetical protein